jgi:hypothetical protein
MASPAIRERIPFLGIYNQVIGILPTQGNNPWIDGVNYAGKLINANSDIISSLNFTPLKDVLIGVGAYDPSPQDKAPVDILISFNDDPASPGYQNLASLGPINPWPSNLKDAYLKAFTLWENVANIRFTEVQEGNPTNIEYYLIKVNTGENVLGAHEGIFDPLPGDPQTSFINSIFYNERTNTDPGSSFLETAIHEIGHGIGLAHPHDGGLDQQIPSPVFVGLNPFLAAGDQYGAFGYGLFSLNQAPNTIMSYNRGLLFDQDKNPLPITDELRKGHSGTPMALDIMNIQLKYGYNTETETGDNIYELTGGPGELSSWVSIWDAGGIDTIEAKKAQNNVAINLRAAPMNAYRPQSEQMSEQYNWEAIGVSDAKSAEALQTIIDVVNAPGSLLGTSYKFAALAPRILEAPTDIKRRGSQGAWTTQSFGDYFLSSIDTSDVSKFQQSIKTTIDTLTITSKLLELSDFNYRKEVIRAELEQEQLLLESTKNVGGYYSQVLKHQGGFTIAAGVEIENATGSAFADSITGNFLPNVLIGRSGNDTIDGLQGDDVINGGGGDDELNGNFGADKISGGIGKNIFLSAEDGFTDTLVIQPDRDGGQNFDIIEGLDPFDIVLISDTGAEPLSARDISSDGLARVGIFVGNNLEALYTGGTLTSQQIQDLTSFIA